MTGAASPNAAGCGAAGRKSALRRQARTRPQAAKIPIVATSTEIVDWFFHWDPRVAYSYRGESRGAKEPLARCSV